MADQDTGDRVRFDDDERVDAPDAAAMQRLVGAAVTRELGATFGYVEKAGSLAGACSGGCLTNPQFDGIVPAATTIQPFMFLEARRLGDGASPFARVVRYDPANPWQSTLTVNLGPYVAGSDLAWIYARRIEVDASQDARIKWESGAEKATAVNTATREAVAFTTGVAAVPATPLTGGDWVPVARVVGWFVGIPLIKPLSAFDPFVLADNPNGPVESLSAEMVTMGHVSGAHLLWLVRSALAAQRDSTLATAWNASPTRGFTQLEAVLAYIEQRIILAHASFELTAAPGAYNAPVATSVGFTGAVTAVGTVTVTMSNPGFAARICAIQVTPRQNNGGTAADQDDLNFRVEILDTNPQAVGPHFRVHLFNAAGVAKDQSFYLEVSGRKV